MKRQDGTVTIRLPGAVKERCKVLAQLLGKTLSEWAREAVLRALELEAIVAEWDRKGDESKEVGRESS